MTTQVKPIRGKVARVLNDREVALNRGLDHGVSRGMEFDILSRNAQEVRDPDTDELLGSPQRPKVRVRVNLVYNDKMSVAETFRKRRVNVGGKGVGLGLFEPPKWEDHYETLRIEDARVDEIGELDSYVSRGDPVVQVLGVSRVRDSESPSEGAPRPNP